MDERYAKIKAEFDAIDRLDSESYRQFFLRYPYLSTNDLAQITDRCAATIRRRKKMAGLGSKNPPTPPRNVRLPIIMELPCGWDTKEWWEAHYPLYGGHDLARITGLSTTTVYKKLRKHGIQIQNRVDTQKSKNPCCTEEWCREHYEKRQLSINKCSKMAGVSKETFTAWLNRFKIEVRGITYGPTVGEIDGV